MSEQLTLAAETRDRVGKGASRALRRDGRVPAVIYGNHQEPRAVSLNERELTKALMTGHFFNSVVMIDGERTLPKDVSFDVVSDRPIHADFLRISEHATVTVAIPVVFLNEDKMFHNVFSLSRPNDFDLGLYEKGVARSQKFDAPGAVRLLCNIHSSMSAFVYVVDSPWYTQADATGQFTLRGVPPGEYMLHAWHEGSARPSVQPVTVTEGLLMVSASVTADAERPTFVPDKAGKPRQPQLGY